MDVHQKVLLVDAGTSFYRTARYAVGDFFGPVDLGLHLSGKYNSLNIGVGPLAGSILPGSNRLIVNGKLTTVDTWAGRGGMGSKMLQQHGIAAVDARLARPFRQGQEGSLLRVLVRDPQGRPRIAARVLRFMVTGFRSSVSRLNDLA